MFMKWWNTRQEYKKQQKEDDRAKQQMFDNIANSIMDNWNSMFFQVHKIVKIKNGYFYKDTIKILRFRYYDEVAGCGWYEYELYVDNDRIFSSELVSSELYNFLDEKYKEYTPKRIEENLSKLDIKDEEND